MKIQFIFTFDDMPQVITKYNEIYYPLMVNKDVLIAHSFTKLDNQQQKENLIKISCCVSDASNLDCPKWYEECNGKIWVDDLEIFRAENNIRSTVSKDYLTQFELSNK